MDVAAENLFRYSRAAISGGGRTVHSLHTLILKGRSRFVVDDVGGLAGAAVEIKLLLPDHYLRTDTSGVLQKMAGYAGGRVLSAMHDDAAVSYPPDRLVSQILLNERLRVARLLLGTATYVGPDSALAFRSVPKSRRDGRPARECSGPRSPSKTRAPNRSSALVTGDRFAARPRRGRLDTCADTDRIHGTGQEPRRRDIHSDRRGGRRSPDAVPHRDHEQRPPRSTSSVLDEILSEPGLSKSDFKR